MNWLKANADGIAGILAALIVGQRYPEWGIISLGVGAIVYLAVQWFVPATRAGIGPSPFKK